MPGRRIATLLAALALPAAAQAGPLTGVWGGDQAQLTLTDSGGTLQLGCAEGRLAGPVTLDAHGRFRAAGTLEVHGPGPQRAEPGPAGAAARFTGAVEGRTLRLAVRSGGGTQTYVLAQGVRPRIVRCL